ncbi:MAG: GNAT family N-acetyltransferase [Clostridia bacterium]
MDIYEYLTQNTLLHIDMIDALKRGIGHIRYAAEDGVLLYNRVSSSYLISCKTRERAGIIAKSLPSTGMVTLHQEEYVDLFLDLGFMPELERCYQAAYLCDMPMEGAEGFDIRLLTMEHLPFIIEHYNSIDDKAYIEQCLKQGMFGAFDGGALMGFIGMHLEGSMGLLHILPQYRKRGVGGALEAYLVNYLLGCGRIPYGQVIYTNQASLNLQRRLGFSISKERLVWISKQGV